MKVQFTSGKFAARTNADVAAVGYKVWAYLAGTSTAATTYSDPDCTAANAWPVVLNARGEAFIYLNVSTDLYLTTDTAVDISAPIWVSTKVARQEGVPPLLATVTPGTTHNNYAATISPVATSIANQQIIVFTPDVTNVTTLTSTVFTGTGIDDATFTGPYTGSTTGAAFSVQIDGVAFHGTGLSDVAWGGTPLTGHVYTVKISLAAATDEFQWRKDGGAWSASIAMTGAAQALTDGVTVTFTATTGHTLNDLWNNVNTFKWRVDAGSWTEGVAISAAAQTLQNNIKVTFAQKLGHTLSDLWVLTVETPVRFNFCALGNKIVYKNVAGTLQALDGGDLVQDIPVTIVYSLSQDSYILNNPSLPVLEALIPSRIRKEITAAYSITIDDQGMDISATGTFTVTMPDCPDVPHTFYYIRNSGSGTITVDATTYSIKGPGGTSATTYALYPGDAIQIETNGVDWQILTAIAVEPTTFFFPTTGTYTKTPGTKTVLVFVYGGGGGGGGSTGAGEAGGGGGAGGYTWEIIDVSAVATVSVTAGAGGAGAGGAGNAGGTSSFGAYCSATGGSGGGQGAGGIGGAGGAGGAGSGGTISITNNPGATGTPGAGAGGAGGYNYHGFINGMSLSAAHATGIGAGGYGGVNGGGGYNGSPGAVYVIEFAG